MLEKELRYFIEQAAFLDFPFQSFLQQVLQPVMMLMIHQG